ncbi:MAG: PAS domain S-box protein [Nitrospira sp.]|nr:PAS domain S-box protein [Nitrospira sp.]
MNSPLETDDSTCSAPGPPRNQGLEPQQTPVQTKQGRSPVQLSTVGAVHVGTWEWNSRTNRVNWSSETAQIFDLVPDSRDGSYEEFFAHVHPDDGHYLKTSTAQALETRSSYEIDYRIITPSGVVRWVACFGRTMVDETESVSGMMGTVEDITARKEFELTQHAFRETMEALVRERTAVLEQTILDLKNQIGQNRQIEAALKSSEQRYQLLYEHNPFIYFTLLPDGTVVSVNRFGADQLGYRAEDLVGQSIVKVFDSREHHTVLQQLATCATHPYTAFQWEAQKTRRDGTRLWVKEHAQAIHDHTDQILILVTCEDITGRKRTEKQLHETSRLLSTLVEESALPIVSLDREARVVSWNHAATRLFGWSREEVLGRELPYIQAGGEPAADALWQAGLRRELTGPVELQRQRKDGKVLNLLLWPVFVYDEFEEVSLAVGLYVDQSDLKRAEAAKVQSEAQLARLIEHFPGVIARVDHALRCTYASPGYEWWFGKNPESIISLTIEEVIGKEAFLRTLPLIMRALAGERVVFENHMPTKSGETWHGLITLEPEFDDSGACKGFSVFAIDNTERRLAEEQVRENEARWRAFYEHAGVGIAQLSQDGHFLRVNPHLCELLGYSAGALLQRNFQELTHPDDLPSNLPDLHELQMKHRHPFSVETRCRRSDRTWVWVDLRVSLVQGISGDQDYFIAVIQNITDRKYSYSLLQAAINSVADGLLIVDRHGKVTSMNQRFLHFWNIPQTLADGGDDEALLSFVLDQLQEPDAFLRKVRELYAHPAQESFDVVAFKDGRVFERYSRPQVLDNEIVGRVWSFRDITEHKLAEQALRESELRLQRFVAEAPVGLCILDENWRAIIANRALCELTGYEQHEIVGSTYALYTHPEDLSAHIQLTDEFYRGIRSAYTHEKRYIRKSGEIIWVSVKATRIELSGHQGPLLLAAVQDITERKLALAEREQLSRDLHDNLLQTLYAVGLQLEAGKLAMERSPRRSKTHLSHAIRQLNGLMVDVRRFIALLTERTPVQLDFGQALRALVDSTADTACLAAELDIKSPVLSFITPQLGEQLLNIAREALSNSVRHARASRRCVHLSLTQNSIRLLIGDNGIGFSPTRKRRAGRGLANMAVRAQHMGALFSLESLPGHGTTITVDVPLKKDALYA